MCRAGASPVGLIPCSLNGRSAPFSCRRCSRKPPAGRSGNPNEQSRRHADAGKTPQPNRFMRNPLTLPSPEGRGERPKAGTRSCEPPLPLGEGGGEGIISRRRRPSPLTCPHGDRSLEANQSETAKVYLPGELLPFFQRKRRRGRRRLAS